jgi:hypothetical protein
MEESEMGWGVEDEYDLDHAGEMVFHPYAASADAGGTGGIGELLVTADELFAGGNTAMQTLPLRRLPPQSPEHTATSSLRAPTARPGTRLGHALATGGWLSWLGWTTEEERLSKIAHGGWATALRGHKRLMWCR